MLIISLHTQDTSIFHGISEMFRLFFGNLFNQEKLEVNWREAYSHKLILTEEKNGHYTWEFIKDSNDKDLPPSFTLNTENSLHNLLIKLKELGSEKEEILIQSKLEIETNNFFEAKRDLKCLLYKILVSLTYVKFPWGSLTGIRPTLIVQRCMQFQTEILLQSKDIQKLKLEEYLKPKSLAYILLNEYFMLSSSKCNLGLKTAYEESKLAKKIKAETHSIYVSIPFCPTRCTYCTFSPLDGINKKEKDKENYVKALLKHIDEVLKVFRPPLNSLYIGGGTPSELTSSQLDALLELLRFYYPYAEASEWTLEAGRPDTLDEDKLRVAKKWKVERICINPQTFHNSTLKRINRRHSVTEIYEIFHLARNLGFSDINMDLIIGLPGEDKEMFLHSLAEIKRLSPDSFTVHALALKKKSQITKQHFENESSNIIDLHRPSELLNSFMEVVEETATCLGMVPYYMYRQKQGVGGLENVGYAKPGKGSIYNVAMMGDLSSILGFGVGAMSKRKTGTKIERLASIKSVYEFMNNLESQTTKKIDFFNNTFKIN